MRRNSLPASRILLFISRPLRASEALSAKSARSIGRLRITCYRTTEPSKSVSDNTGNESFDIVQLFYGIPLYTPPSFRHTLWGTSGLPESRLHGCIEGTIPSTGYPLPGGYDGRKIHCRSRRTSFANPSIMFCRSEKTG